MLLHLAGQSIHKLVEACIHPGLLQAPGQAA